MTPVRRSGSYFRDEVRLFSSKIDETRMKKKSRKTDLKINPIERP
jgi:hypothetical protein